MFRFKRNQILVISDLHSSKKNMNSKELNIYKKPQRKQNDKIYIYIYIFALLIIFIFKIILPQDSAEGSKIHSIENC